MNFTHVRQCFSFGAKIRSMSTGIILNDLMDDFSTPGTINEFGVPASPANYIVPRKRPLSSMCPTIILDKDRHPVLIVGAAGGTRIPTAVAQNILQILYLNQSLSDAMNKRVRLHHQLAPMEVSYEAGVSEELLAELRKLGHKTNAEGGGVLTAVLRRDGQVYAAFDPRSGGSVAYI